MDLNRLVSKNQTIKIIPSIEESLKLQGLDVSLDENVTQWFDQLKISWKTFKNSSTIENHIDVLFETHSDPFRIALVFVIKCGDFKDVKPKSLPYFIIEVLQKWSQKYHNFPKECLKLPAFFIATQQRNQHFLNLVVKTYQLSSKKDVILPMVKEMIKSNNCKQASQVVIAMDLFDDIPVEDLLFPLILQDKANMIDEYFNECPSQVKPFLIFLDNLLNRSLSMREYVQRYIEEKQISHVKYDKIHSKPIGKLIARLCNKYKIPIETCTNLSKYRTTGGLRYLIHQRYIEKNVSSSVWDDLVKDSLKQNADSALQFIDMLIDHDKKEALKWAEFFEIPETTLPLALQNISLQDMIEENWDVKLQGSCQNSQEYYKLSLSDDQIILIDSAEKMYDLIMCHLIKSNVLGVDCEWKPTFGATQSHVALIQIATTHNVYLIDTMILNHNNYTSFWYTFHKSILENSEIIKLGFGLEQDLREIKASVAGLGNIRVKGEGLLDIGLLWKALIDSKLTLPNTDAGNQSLSSLVQSCFGLPLEKSEQCSNWELRPLRNTQLRYAALDAHILIEIYYFLQRLSLEQGLDFEEICNDVMLEGKKKCPSKKNKVCDRIQMSLNDFKIMSVKNIKFLVEPILSNIMVYLRYCGIDTTVMSDTNLWHEVINLAISEERFILLKRLKCSPTGSYPQSSILVVNAGTIKEQVQKVIDNYNIKIKQSDLFTICINCNSKDLKMLEFSEVSKICNDYQSAPSINFSNQSYTESYEDNYDNFFSDSEDDEIYHSAIPSIKKCVTSKGVAIEINNIQSLIASHKPATLCESCGRLFWEGDELYKSVNDLILSLINITK